MSTDSKQPGPINGNRDALVQCGLESLFEDQKFSGDLMTRLFRLGMSEEEMDAIFKHAEDDIIGFVNALEDSGASESAQNALGGYVFRLKRQILRNPLIYVSGN